MIYLSFWVQAEACPKGMELRDLYRFLSILLFFVDLYQNQVLYMEIGLEWIGNSSECVQKLFLSVGPPAGAFKKDFYGFLDICHFSKKNLWSNLDHFWARMGVPPQRFIFGPISRVKRVKRSKPLIFTTFSGGRGLLSSDGKHTCRI